MKKIAVLIPFLLLGLLFSGCGKDSTVFGENPEQAAETNESTVRLLVEDFGGRLQQVSLAAPDVRDSLKNNYGDYVTPALLEKWRSDPGSAPGKPASGLRPDRIEVRSVEREASDAYWVTGVIVEETDAEQSGGSSLERAVSLEVKRIGGKWFIDDVSLGVPAGAETLTYENTEFGFTFVLPGSWKGYSIVTDQWDGASLEEGKTGRIMASGPKLSIRHPEWTEENPRQDIPIMVFTIAQWDAMKSGKFHIGAAPIDPSELGRNSAYVFALPARYNYAFPTGYEEVEDILKGNPLKPVEIYGDASSSKAPSSSSSAVSSAA